MRILRASIAVISLTSATCYAQEPRVACASEVLGKELGYDFPQAVRGDRRTYIQPRNGRFGLSDDAVVLVDGFEGLATAEAVPLCDTNMVIVWKPETYGRGRDYLHA